MLAVGAAVGGVVSTVFGRDTAFVVNAVSFAVSALLLSGIRRPFSEQREAGHEHPKMVAATVEVVLSSLLPPAPPPAVLDPAVQLLPVPAGCDVRGLRLRHAQLAERGRTRGQGACPLVSRGVLVHAAAVWTAATDTTPDE